ncbi:hypothetical protein ACHAXR_007185 [Thalassiosira sp. AJA248-18]
MNGSPTSRYISEEEIALGGGAPPSNPFSVNNDDDYDDGYANGDDAYPENGEAKNGSNLELWKDDIRSQNRNGHSFEMVPLSKEDDLGEFNYENEDEGGDDARHVRRSHQSNTPFSGDDYATSNTFLPKSVYQYIFPPTVPRAVQLCRPENIAVPACYLLVGLLQGLSGPFTNVYPLDLNASEAQQATISSLKSLPSTFKLAFGFLSDNVPLCGYRRKSYMLLGWAITSFSMCLLLFFSDLSMDAVELQNNQEGSGGGGDDDSAGRYQRQLQSTAYPPSIPFLSFSLLLFGTGFWFADVMGDSIVAEKAKLEPESSRGHLQSTCYACRFFGLMIAAPLSTVIYSSYGPRAVVVLMAGLPASIVPLVYILKETKNVQVASTKDQCSEIWNTVCSRAVWQPMGFVYLYNVLQVGNAAWKQYLKTVLEFTSNQLNSLLIVAYILLWLGIMAYKKFFIKWSWRTVYISTTLLNGIFSALQILLIKGITFGLSPFLFALGDDAFADFIGGIQFLPTTIMMVHLCPSGSEGASYAMFTTMSNSAYTVSTAFSTLLLGVWDVSKEAMERGDLSGMINLTALTTLIQVSGVLFVGLLPRTKEDLANLHSDGMSGSKIGGFIFLFVTFASVLYSLVIGALNIISPGWAGES